MILAVVSIIRSPATIASFFERNRIMKHIIIAIVFIALFLATLIFTYWYIRRAKELADTRGYIRGYNYVKSIAELQKQALMEPDDRDGVWGEKTNKAYNRVYCNQEAVKMFERMSGK